MIRQRFSWLVSLMALVVALGACSSIRDDYVKKPSTALPPATTSPRDRYIQAATNQHPADSGFRLLIGSTNALMSRVALADHAKQSIDLQYYIFESRWMRRHGPATERAVVALQLWALKQPALLSAMVRCAPP